VQYPYPVELLGSGGGGGVRQGRPEKLKGGFFLTFMGPYIVNVLFK